jgi:hypothetical protein
MKITVKTELLTIEVDVETVVNIDGTLSIIPTKFNESLPIVIHEAVRLHNELIKNENK